MGPERGTGILCYGTVIKLGSLSDSNGKQMETTEDLHDKVLPTFSLMECTRAALSE